MNKLLEEVAKDQGVTVAEIKSRKRNRPIAYARHLFCYVAYKGQYGHHKEIGDVINRNHATVTHSIKGCSDLLELGYLTTNLV